MLWGAGIYMIAVVLRLLARQHAVRLADRTAEEHRPPAYERAALARSWIITLFWVVLMAEVLLGAVAMVIAVLMLVSDPSGGSAIFFAAVEVPVLSGVAFPEIDPIPAYARGSSRNDTDKDSVHLAGLEEENDVEEPLRRCRDTAHGFGDVEG